MCTNGINTGQFEQMIDQIDDHISWSVVGLTILPTMPPTLDSPPWAKSSMLQCSCSTRFAQRSMTLKMHLMKMPKTQVV